MLFLYVSFVVNDLWELWNCILSAFCRLRLLNSICLFCLSEKSWFWQVQIEKLKKCVTVHFSYHNAPHSTLWPIGAGQLSGFNPWAGPLLPEPVLRTCDCLALARLDLQKVTYVRVTPEHLNFHEPHLKTIIHMLYSSQRPNLTSYPFTYVLNCCKLPS